MISNTAIQSLSLGDKFRSPYYLTECYEKIAKNGNTYSDLTLRDKSGYRYARLWGKIPSSMVNNYVFTVGHVEEFMGNPQIVVEKIELVDKESLNMADFISIVPNLDSIKQLFIQTLGDFKNPTCQVLAKKIFDDKDFMEKFMKLPCSEGPVYGAEGGILYKTVTMLSVAEQICECYSIIYPDLKEDLSKEVVKLGVILSNIGCVNEWEFNQCVPKKTLMGELIGGNDLAVGKLGVVINTLKNEKVELDAKVLTHVLHVVGSVRWSDGLGNPPKTIEAIIVNQTYQNDETISSVVGFINNDRNEEELTSYSVLHKRHFYRPQTLKSEK